ncbi:MAG TPA: DinB family protein [Gemmatimonadaceae bacterium]|nr:DinB family protein [Gemmatimonadaceae bacterium]
MHTRIAELLDFLDAQREVLRAAVARVPADAGERRPAPDRWSAAEILEHLSLVERSVAGLLTARLAEARAGGLGPDTATTSVLATFDLRRVLDRSRRVTASTRAQPSQGLDAAAAWAALERTRAALREAVLAADGLALGEVTHSHAALGTLTLYEWIAFVGGHEARHAAQIDEIVAALADGGSPAADRSSPASTTAA